jgi:hypothetical protein
MAARAVEARQHEIGTTVALVLAGGRGRVCGRQSCWAKRPDRPAELLGQNLKRKPF